MRTDYQVVLMDCQMPAMNGLVATAEIRQREDGSRRPAIVAITAETGEEWRQRCRQAGVDDVLEKPVRTHVLADVLNRYARTPGRTARDVVSAATVPGGIDGLVAEVGIELTLELAREYLAGVSKALETLGSGDAAATGFVAHRLLGSARMLGLSTFERLWLRVEDHVSSRAQIPGATIDELRRACVEFGGWIEKHHDKQHCA
jgi:two-component system sensor histidine kinase EvgS